VLNDLTTDKTESCFCRSMASACHCDLHIMDGSDLFFDASLLFLEFMP
jgi:hypothetical protein